MAKVISYDAPTNTIDADGGTEGDAIKPLNIYDASVAGGWGVESRIQNHRVYRSWVDDETYIFNCRIRFGQNSVTYVDVQRCGIIAACMVSTSDVVWDCDTAIIVRCHKWSGGNDYSGMQGSGTFNRCLLGWGTGRGDGTYSLIRCAVLTTFYHKGDISYSLITNMFNPRNDGPTREHNIIGSELESGNGEREFRNILFSPGADGNPYGATATQIYVDTENVVPDMTHDGSAVIEKFTFARPVQDNTGAAISGATVVITDGEDTEVANYNTNASGLPAAETLLTTRKWEDIAETLTDYSPFTVSISKAGYQTHTEISTVDNPQEDAITLLDWSECPAEADVELLVVYGEGTRIGQFVGLAHYLEGEVFAPLVTGGVEAPTIRGTVGAPTIEAEVEAPLIEATVEAPTITVRID